MISPFFFSFSRKDLRILMMKRNCQLEMGLQPRNCSHRNSISNEPLDITHHNPYILHNGRPCFFDVTELQARVIIWLASREMEERIGRRESSTEMEERIGRRESSTSSSSISSFSLQSQALMCGGGGLSLKKSLQTFLKKRKQRIQQIKPQCE